ncbi:hypothetical protein IC762_12430 [Bradyrhizobium genosp. L]|uniref:hypothetical protein n=1 Tax=Bradyrhizobium genosp. L TaxID=83637 RepID=UPI0018A29A5D|nr:hypothetical protein [Bradyrhizobium genosp. L]QPF87049.1 hypothetical protein IC762_12430 [Bradyrhizobium genosp. L]
MTNITTTNLPNGITNAALNTVMSSYGAPDPSVFHSYWNDFDTFASGDWTNTATGSVTNAIVAGNGGILSLGNSAANNDLDSLQLKAATFAIVAGYKAWFKCRLNISNATNAALTIGMIQTTTTPLTVTDGLWFSKAAATTAMNFNIAKSSTTTTLSSVATLANTTYLNIGWHYDGGSTVSVYVNNARVAGTSVLTNLPTANLNLTLAVANGTAAANTLLIDYVGMFNERDSASL